MRARSLMFSVVLASYGWASVSAAADPLPDHATDAEVSQAVQRAHTVMAAQRLRLQQLLDDFLLGDAARLQYDADALAAAMHQVTTMYPPTRGQAAEQWQAVGAILTHTGQLKAAAARQDYPGAFAAYSALTQQCLACHQTRRTWGRLPEPSAEPLPPGVPTDAPVAPPSTPP